MPLSKRLREKVPKEIVDQIKELKKKRRYLRSSESKDLLQKVLDLYLSWPELEELLDRNQTTIEKILSFHDLRKPRRLHLRYCDKAIQVIVDYYADSSQFILPRDRKAAHTHKMKMVDEVYKIQEEEVGDEKRITANALQMVARSVTEEDLRRVGRENVSLPLRWGTNIFGLKNKEDQKLSLLTETEKQFLQLLENEPVDASINSFTERIGISEAETLGLIESLTPRLNELGYTLKVDEKQHITVIRKDAEHLQPKIFQIECDPKEYQKEGALVGIYSGIYYPTEGFRQGLVELTETIASEKAVHFGVLVGGLVYGHELESRLRSELSGIPKKDRHAFESLFVMHVAQELAVILPRVIKPDGEFIKLYVLTSPVIDRAIGARVARILTELRKEDIVYWGDRNDQKLPVKNLEKAFEILPAAPQKPSLPGRYASTAIQRQARRLAKIITDLPDMMVFGGYGSSIHKPAAGEARLPYISVPTLHKLSERETREDSESEVGIRFVRFRADGSYTVMACDFKQLMADERQLVRAPPGASEIQKATIEVIKDNPPTMGVLEDRLEVPRDLIRQEIEGLTRFRAGIVYDEPSGRYDFSSEWMRKIRYHWPKEMAEDVIVSLACLHALATYPDGKILTDCKFLLEELPRAILEKNVSIFVAAGDLIQGTRHGQHVKAELFQGLSLTIQERFAAQILGMVIIKVFKSRFEALLQENKKGDLTSERLRKMIESSLLTFLYCAGNHDLWQTADAVDALEYFRLYLRNFLIKEISTTLNGSGLILPSYVLEEIIDARIIKDLPDEKIRYRTPGGLSVKVVHPHTARAETVSIIPERLLTKHLNAQLIIAGNWHVAFDMQQSEKGFGLRHVAECPTILLSTFFEDNKMKRTDFGAWFTVARSHKGIIYEIESGLFGKKIALGFERQNNSLVEKILHDFHGDIFSSSH